MRTKVIRNLITHMTRKELSEQYNISETTIKSQFPKTQKKFLEKYNLILTKQGRGDKTQYFVEIAAGSDGRALTMMKEQKREVILAEKGFSTLLDFNFMVFLGICMTPMTTFYGSYEDFLKYIEVKATPANILKLKEALLLLYSNGYIKYMIDETNEDYFWAGIFFAVRKKMAIGIGMINRCQELAKQYGKKSWVPLLKTWIGIQYMYDKQPFTMKELCNLTGLSEYQIRESKKILEHDNLFITSKAYIGYDTCIGSKIDLNGIYKENREFTYK